ncbi:homeobox-leucine zipper protein HAT14-like [Salvia hispanica]|uniref:homeobox-leucine zipper protein HAT14-like n=1 Tax=Salvia hispanica TaxID=49212 RepID=UPI0020090907|nr:homeobox-leucine zipper protein HAT14-like [Salvia hispanica]XP_047946664.1 homeobox-leucine zipper protein HAT14-like [Salvia hispanica]
MELGLSLGDASKSPVLLKENNSPNQKQNQSGLDFCMSLGLTSKSNNQENDDVSASTDETPLQLNLLPLAPLPRQISSRLWCSDNGSSENGFDVNRTEEASSANSKREFEADDDDGLNARKKLRLSKEQSAFLEDSFKEHNTLNPKQKVALAKQLNLRARQVEVWFQNRRARTKLKQTEVDCEYLKKCCETLTVENRRLQKELQDLRALKTSNPFHAATTLTMCPSCSAAKVIPFPLARPRFYPFPTHPNQPAAS